MTRFEKLDATHPRHSQIEEDETRSSDGRARGIGPLPRQILQRIAAISGGHDGMGETGAAKRTRERFQVELVVVDNQESRILIHFRQDTSSRGLPSHRPVVVLPNSVQGMTPHVYSASGRGVDEYFSKFFDSSDFPARWHCGNWAEFHGWLHVCSDAAVFLAYMAIPLVLVFFLRKRKDIPFPAVFYMFVAFICSCGLTHLIEATIFWVPIYRVAGAMKFVTAVVSWATVGALVFIMPDAVQLRSPASLAREVAERTEQLRAAEALQRAILDTSPVGKLLVRNDGTIRYANQAALDFFRVARVDCEGRDADLFVPDLRSRVDGERRVERVVTQEGFLVDLDVGVNTVEVPDGPEVLVSLIDVTDRLRAERELAARNQDLQFANEELDRFADIASHDLRTPLQGVKSLVGWIEKDNQETLADESKEHLRLVRVRITRLEKLLDDLLEYSRAGRQQLDLEDVEVRALITDTLQILDLPDTAIVELEGAFPTIHTARTPLQQVLQNIIGNAVKHHDKDSARIAVACSHDAGRLEFSVTDDGPGVPVEYRERVFEMFETLRSRDDVEGSGMGLALVKRIVERFGGSISIDDAPGRGAVVRFTWVEGVG